MHLGRGIMPDRMRLIISTDYNHSLVLRESIFEILRPLFDKEVRDDANIKFEKHRYFVLGDEIIKTFSSSDYISHVGMNKSPPYSVSMDMNGIRMVRSHLMKDITSGFNYEHDKAIRINDDNYLNYEIWKDLDRKKICDYEKHIEDEASWICKKTWDLLLEDPSEDYFFVNTISIAKIEFNDEFFVGQDNSYGVMKRFIEWISTNKGRDFISNIGGAGYRLYKDDDFQVGHEIMNSDTGMSVKIHIAKGVWFKVYRKTKEHIRAEVGFESVFLRRKYKTREFSKVYNQLRHIAVRLIKKSGIEAIISQLIFNDNKPTKKEEISDRKNDFLNTMLPGLSEIAEKVACGYPITEKDQVELIRKNHYLKGLFYRKYVKNKFAYFYDPYETLRKTDQLEMML